MKYCFLQGIPVHTLANDIPTCQVMLNFMTYSIEVLSALSGGSHWWPGNHVSQSA